MTRRLAPLALALAALSLAPRAATAQDTRAVPSTITAVTVYEDRALVTRTVSVELQQGVQRVAIEHLPATVDAESLRGRSTQVRLLGLDLENVHLGQQASARLEEAARQYRNAARAASDAELAHKEAQSRWELLQSLRAASVDRASKELGAGQAPDVDAIKKLLDFVTSEGGDARKALVTTEYALEDAKADAEAAKRRLDELRGAAQRVERRVVVTLEADAAGKADFTLAYIVPGAAWKPVYDLRVSADFSSTTLQMGAVVVQRTGEDWNGVELELTTAQPSAGAAPPTPRPWRVDIVRPRPDAGLGARPPAAKAARRAPKAEVADSLELLEAEVRRSGLVVAFRSHTKESVASDGQPARIALAGWGLDADVRWTAFPRATSKVFVTSEMKNTTEAPLPTGEARVFVGPDFMGKTRLDDWGVGETVEVGLGVDREVEVEREELVKKRSTEGVFSTDVVHERSYRLKVSNHRQRRVDVKLLDQIPVSGDEDLEVEVTENTTKVAKLPKREADLNRNRGILEWRFPLQPTEAHELRFTFTVTHPDDVRITGLSD